MTDKKLTDADIVKALEEISHNENLKRYSGIPKVAECALDLINRLQASVEYYKQNRNKYQDDVMYLSKQLDNLQADNERLKKEFIEQKLKNIMRLETSKEIEAEAYKECIEKVQTIICENTYPDFDKNGKAVNIWKAKAYKDIDNLLKELVGDA